MQNYCFNKINYILIIKIFKKKLKDEYTTLFYYL